MPHCVRPTSTRPAVADPSSVNNDLRRDSDEDESNNEIVAHRHYRSSISDLYAEDSDGDAPVVPANGTDPFISAPMTPTNRSGSVFRCMELTPNGHCNPIDPRALHSPLLATLPSLRSSARVASVATCDEIQVPSALPGEGIPSTHGPTAVASPYYLSPVQVWVIIAAEILLIPMVMDRIVSIINDLIFLSIIGFIFMILFRILAIE